MIIATFGPNTGWAGKTITYEGESFILEGHGAITATDVMAYDAQVHLVWASEGTRGWVGARTAAIPRPAMANAPTDPARRSSNADHYMTPWGEVSMLGIAGLFLLVCGLIVVVYYIGFFDTSVPVDTGGYLDIERVNNIGLMNDQRNGIIGGVLAMIGGGVLLFVDYTRGGLRGRAPKDPAPDERRCPYCAETIKSEAVSTFGGSGTRGLFGLLGLTRPGTSPGVFELATQATEETDLQATTRRPRARPAHHQGDSGVHAPPHCAQRALQCGGPR